MQKHGVLFSIVTSSVVFGFAHPGITTIISSIAGITMGLLYVVTGNIVWPIFGHILNNSGILMPSSRSGTGIDYINTMRLNLCIFVIVLLMGYFLKVFDRLKNNGFLQRGILTQFQEDKGKYRAYFSSPGMLLYLSMLGLAGISNTIQVLFPGFHIPKF